MKFEIKGRQYEVNKFGVISQTDHRPYKYDKDYAAIYDKPEYEKSSLTLQAMRYGFVCAAHGRPVNSLCDTGYGNGAFMKFAKQQIPFVYGFDVTGVQVDGCYILPELVKADVITFWDCLEHIPDLSFVKDLPHETICLSLPYCHFFTEGLGWMEEWKHLKPDEHVHHFNEFSLSLLMDSMGWKTVNISGHEDIIRENWILKSRSSTKCGVNEVREKSPLQNILSMAFKRK